MNIHKFIPVVDKLHHLISKRHKVYLGLLVMMTVGLSCIETLGISAIMPFISMASNPSLLDSGWYKWTFDFFGFIEKEKFIIFSGIVIIFFYVFRAVYSVIHMYLVNRFSLALYKYFSKNLFKTFLSVPYKVYAQKNSAELIQITTNEAMNTSNLVLNILQASSEFFTVLLVYALMILINWKMTLVLSAGLSLLVFSFLRVIMTKTKIQGTKRAESHKKLYRTLKETFGNFKFVKLKGNEEGILRIFDASNLTYSRSMIISHTLGIVPKSILESMGFSLLVAVVVFILWNYHDASKVIPVISMYALALYRILPALHRMLLNLNNIAFSRRALDIVDDNTRQPVEIEGSGQIAFEKSIRLERVAFRYMSGSDILNNVSLEIRKGEKIAVTGESGSGKSTLVDLIIGINKPISGTIYIDDQAVTGGNIRSWRSKIGYIPQSVYLFDGTVAENVAFGSESDETRIKLALQKANIWDYLSRKEGVFTLVGDGGIQLSGGQQQRIAIARALYDDPDVLVLDEATSALDTETEMKIMDEIYDNVGGDKTLIVIAHRLSTVERCDRRIRVENQGIYVE
jgi:ATP-binding cassette subfamily B protein/ATP-binding cassette subfamily C protein